MNEETKDKENEQNANSKDHDVEDDFVIGFQDMINEINSQVSEDKLLVNDVFWQPFTHKEVDMEAHMNNPVFVLYKK